MRCPKWRLAKKEYCTQLAAIRKQVSDMQEKFAKLEKLFVRHTIQISTIELNMREALAQHVEMIEDLQAKSEFKPLEAVTKEVLDITGENRVVRYTRPGGGSAF